MENKLDDFINKSPGAEIEPGDPRKEKQIDRRELNREKGEEKDFKKINEKIEGLEERNAEVEEELKKAREGLFKVDGENESPQSVEANKKKIEDLKKELGSEEVKKESLNKEDSSIEGKNEEEIEEFKIERVRAEKFIDTVKGFINVLSRRKADRINPIIDDSEASRMKTAVNNILEIISNKKYSQDDIDRELNNIAGAIIKIGEVRPSRVINEDLDSLAVLRSKLRNIQDESNALLGYISKFPGDQTERTKKVLHRISENSQKKWILISRKIDALSGYRR